MAGTVPNVFSFCLCLARSAFVAPGERPGGTGSCKALRFNSELTCLAACWAPAGVGPAEGAWALSPSVPRAPRGHGVGVIAGLQLLGVSW